jgi:hypothetical protein
MLKAGLNHYRSASAFEASGRRTRWGMLSLLDACHRFYEYWLTTVWRTEVEVDGVRLVCDSSGREKVGCKQ